ncbi:hypothetical protein JCM9492_11060 [Aquifex pyrophilus]
MAQLSDVVKIVGPTAVQDLLTNKILVKASPKTQNVFVPVSSSASTNAGTRKGKVLKVLKSFEEV